MTDTIKIEQGTQTGDASLPISEDDAVDVLGQLLNETEMLYEQEQHPVDWYRIQSLRLAIRHLLAAVRHESAVLQDGRLLHIAGLVNGYHNDDHALSAAETLREIANVLGRPMERDESAVLQVSLEACDKCGQSVAVMRCLKNHRAKDQWCPGSGQNIDAHQLNAQTSARRSEMASDREGVTAGETAPLQVSGWQPIETAPKDRRWLLGWHEDFGHFVFRDGPGLLTGEDPMPTHWQPLPPPPLPVSGGQEQKTDGAGLIHQVAAELAETEARMNKCGLPNRSGGGFWLCILTAGHQGPCDFKEQEAQSVAGVEPPAENARQSDGAASHKPNTTTLPSGGVHRNDCAYLASEGYYDCDCQQETPEQEIERVRESYGRVVGQLRMEISAYREVLQEADRWLDGWCPTATCCAESGKELHERIVAILREVGSVSVVEGEASGLNGAGAKRKNNDPSVLPVSGGQEQKTDGAGSPPQP